LISPDSIGVAVWSFSIWDEGKEGGNLIALNVGACSSVAAVILFDIVDCKVDSDVDFDVGGLESDDEVRNARGKTKRMGLTGSVIVGDFTSGLLSSSFFAKDSLIKETFSIGVATSLVMVVPFSMGVLNGIFVEMEFDPLEVDGNSDVVTIEDLEFVGTVIDLEILSGVVIEGSVDRSDVVDGVSEGVAEGGLSIGILKRGVVRTVPVDIALGLLVLSVDFTSSGFTIIFAN
jgi:hypothetical protein